MLLRNRGGVSFVDVTVSSGTGELHKGHGVAFADLDGDGDQEIVFKVGGATPGDAHAFRLFDNPGGGRRLARREPRRRAERTVPPSAPAMTATVDNDRDAPHHSSHGEQRRLVRRVAAAPALGLGRDARVVERRDLVAGQQHAAALRNVAKNQVIEVKELEDRFSTVKVPPVSSGGAPRVR